MFIRSGMGFRPLVVVGCLLLGGGLVLPDAAAQQRPRQGARRAPVAAAPAATPQEAFERARSAATQKERIALLEKFLAAHRGAEQENEARELLMREYALQGEQNLREGSPQLAIKDFQAVLRLAPEPVSERVFSQYLFPLPMAMNAFGYRTESAQLMRSFEARFENDPARLVQIGFFYVQIEAPLEAVRVLERAVRLAPDDHRAHNSLGTAYLINLRLDAAAEEFERALQINPRDEFANLNLGNLARANGDYERAVSFYRKQIELKPTDAEAHGGMAIALLALGRDEEAERFLKSAMEMGPENYHFFTQLAYFYTARRKYPLARPLIERAARIEPRYAWTFIAKANLDLAESKYGNALSTMIQAQQLGSFATLQFELAKVLMALDGYDQALEVMNKGFTVSEAGEFETLLGGVVRARSPRLDLLLERERQAALMLDVQPTTSLQFRLAEALVRLDAYLKTAAEARQKNETAARRGGRKAAPRPAPEDPRAATRPRRTRTEPATGELSAGADADLPGMEDALQAIRTLTTLDDGRQAFRMVWVSRRLTESNLALDAAEQLARQALAMADAATEPEGSMRDAPLLDREGRRRVFLGRVHDALGWALFKKGDTRGAIDHLSKAVDIYPPNLERKNALWHLGVAMEQAGDERNALEYYIASYEPSSATAAARRNQIEALYKRVNGSLAGLEEKLKEQ